ncbi:uncharacterized protein LOC110176982 [Drosophila serrata]|uniref:uncharacterized protein LOC110176982 n=1 Tax=Drosophila serrata TaxID=7274 RepID=UPI000A1D0B87|nr:uncharacterized protein LOC110176982 [Drosophila serrata]
MKLVLWLALCSIAGGGVRNYARNDNCLKRNRYRHESTCHSPRRVFYAFHRIIENCVQVTTNCPRIHRHNEYNNLTKCREDCWFFMDHRPTTKPPRKIKINDKKKVGGTANKTENKGMDMGKEEKEDDDDDDDDVDDDDR